MYHILRTTMAVSECCWSAFFIWWRKVTFLNPSFFRRRFVSSSANEWGKTQRYDDAKYTRTHTQLFETTNIIFGCNWMSSHAATPKVWSAAETNVESLKCRNIAWHGVVRFIWRLTFVNAPRTHSHPTNYTISEVKLRFFIYFISSSHRK